MRRHPVRRRHHGRGLCDGWETHLPHSPACCPREDWLAPSTVKSCIISLDPKGELAWSGYANGSFLAEVLFTPGEVQAIDKALDGMEMSAIFGGSAVRS